MSDFINLNYIKTISFEDNDDYYLVYIQGIVEPTRCPHCRNEKLYKHGTVEQIYMDTPMHGKKVVLKIDRKRYKCTNEICKKTIFEPLTDMDSKRLATSRLVSYIERNCLKKTFADISREVGVDDKTIRHIFDDYADRLKKTIKFETPEVLGIDEIKIIGDYRAIITNIKELSVFDLLESRKKNSLMTYFSEMPDKHNIKVVTMDMWRPYYDTIKFHLPKVPIVVDRFHVVRTANNALEAIRKKVRRELTTSKRIKLKDDRFILLSRGANLNSNQIMTLNNWVNEFPILHEAYKAKEQFFSIYEQESKEVAQKVYENWEKGLPTELRPYFSDLIKAMRNWWLEIFNYYDYPITNGYTESANNLVKEMNRMGRGYSFDVIRARILFDAIARQPTTKSIRGKGGKLNKPKDDVSLTFSGIFDSDSSGLFGKNSSDIESKTVEYGPHIPTLVRLLKDGYFS